MRRQPPRSTLDRSSAASDVYKRQGVSGVKEVANVGALLETERAEADKKLRQAEAEGRLSLIHISEPTRPY